MFVDRRSLRFSEADEIDDVGKDLDETIVSGLEKVVERKVGDAALCRSVMARY